MCVVIHRHDLHSVFKDDVSFLEIVQRPSDRESSFHRHFKVLFIDKLPSEPIFARRRTSTGTPIDDVQSLHQERRLVLVVFYLFNVIMFLLSWLDCDYS